jgi:hypothetical protein
MHAVVRFSLAAALVAGVTTPAAAQLGFGGKPLVLKRTLPPAVSLDAKSFMITASAQEPSGNDVAASFKEIFKAKVQGDERFIYTDVNPALRMSIIVTRFYVEPKSLVSKKGPCTTNLGSLQGTFSVVDSETGRPYASDAIGWKLQTTETRHVLVSDDGDMVGITGPSDKLNPTQFWTSAAQDKSLFSKIGIGRNDHPCDNPFTANEARDALADAFLTDIIRLATPYTTDVEVPVSGDRFLRNALEEIKADRWSQALDQLLLIKEQPKADDEAARLHLLGVAYEGLGYKQGVQAFAISQKIQPRLAPDELARLQGELARIVDVAKDYFDKSSLSFNKANQKNDKEEYRAGERRADQSRALYARIQKYRDLKPVQAEAAKRTRLTMAEVADMCSRNMAEVIIVDQISAADDLAITRQQVGELVKCGDKQTAIFNALKLRWDAAAAPAGAAPAAAPKAPAAKAPAGRAPAPKAAAPKPAPRAAAPKTTPAAK